MRPWVDGLTFGQALARTADQHGNRDALAFCKPAYRRSYVEFRNEVREVAPRLWRSESSAENTSASGRQTGRNGS